MALPLLHAGTGAGGVPDVGALKWSSGGAFVWSDDDYIVPSLDLNFALFKDLRPRIGPTPSFTRASTGTYFNASGVLTTAAINGPRFDHVYNGSSWVSKGLLVEEARTNLLTYSESLNLAPWVFTAASVSANSALAPDGSFTADKLVEDSTYSNHRIYANFSGAKTCFSGFFKSSGRRYVLLMIYSTSQYSYFDLVDGVVVSTNSADITPKITNAGNGWYRCSVAYTGAITSQYLQIHMSLDGITDNYTGDGSSGIYMWGVQAETNSAFPTSYIPTTTAAVPRSADVCQITGSDFSGFYNQSEGSFAVEFDRPMVGSITGDSMICIAAGSGAPSTIQNGAYITSGNITAYGYNSAFTYNFDHGSQLANTIYKIATGIRANDFASSLNGAAILTDNSGTVGTNERLLIGYLDWSTGVRLNGHIARLRYYNTRLTNSQLQVLST